MANITLNINSLIGKLHDHAVEATKGMGTSLIGKLVFSKGAVLQNTGISTYDNKSSEFRGGTGPYKIVILKLGNLLTNAGDSKIHKMLKAYFEAFSGEKNINTSGLVHKSGTMSDLGLGTSDRAIKYAELEYTISYKTVPEAVSSVEVREIEKAVDASGKKENKKEEEGQPAKGEESKTEPEKSTPSSTGDVDGFSADDAVNVVGDSLDAMSLPSLYRRAKLISENAFFETKPFVKKQEDRELVVEFLK